MEHNNLMSVERVEQVETRLTKMFRSITDNPHGASHGISNLLGETRLTISDLSVIITKGDVESTLNALLKEIRELRANVARLKGSQGLTWDAFVEACSRKFDTDAKGFRKALSAKLGISMQDLAVFQNNNRVPQIFLKRIDELSDTVIVETIKERKKTNFNKLGGEIVDALKNAGMPPTDISILITQFLKDYDGTEVTVNQVLGRRTAVSQDKIGSVNDGSKISIPELTAMGNQLWDKNAYKRPMETFVQTHTQIDVTGYNTKPDVLNRLSAKDRGRLRRAYHNEIAMRAKHPKYERFSKAFAIMPKRTKVRQAILPVNIIDNEYITKRVNLWFDESFAIQCLEAFAGWDERYISDILSDRRQPPEELTALISNMDKCLTGIDLDDIDFVDKVFPIVKVLRGELDI